MISENTKEKIIKWVETEPLVKAAYVFGSRARDDFRSDSDLDIAVELNKPPGDEELLATWVCEGDDMQIRVNEAIPEYKVDLQWLDGKNTPIIFSGVNESGYLVYKKYYSSAT